MDVGVDMHIKHSKRERISALTTEGVARPANPTSRAKEAAFTELAVWVNQDSGNEWQARQDLAQAVRTALSEDDPVVELDRRLETLARDMPSSVASLVDLRFASARSLATGNSSRREDRPDGSDRSDRSDQRAVPHRKRTHGAATEDRPGADEPPKKKHKSAVARAPDARHLTRRSRHVLEDLEPYAGMLGKWKAAADDLMKARAPAIFMTSLMAELNREMVKKPWCALGRLVRDIRRTESVAGHGSTTEVQHAVALAQDMFHCAMRVMSHMHECAQMDARPGMLLSAFFSGLRGLTLSGIAEVDRTCSKALRDAYAQAMLMMLDMDRSACRDPTYAMSCSNGLKEGLEHGVIEGRLMCRAYRELMTLVNARDFDSADERAIANLLNGMKALLDRQALPESEHPPLQDTLRRLMTLVNGDAFDAATGQNVANVFNALKAVLETQALLDADVPLIQRTLRRLLKLVLGRTFDKAQSQTIGNAFNGVKAVLETRAMPHADDQPLVRETLRRLMALVCASNFDTANAQEIANVFNGMKAVLETQALSVADFPTVQATMRRLMRLVCGQAFDEANSQAIGNTLNGMKTVLEMSVFTQVDDQQWVHRTLRRLMKLVRSEAFDNARPQHISNAFNALKSAVETRGLPDADLPDMKRTLYRLMELADHDAFGEAGSQAIANVFNAMKTVLVKRVFVDATDLQQVLSTLLRLAGLVDSDAFATANSQEISNAFNSLAVSIENGMEARPEFTPALHRLLRMALQGNGFDHYGDHQVVLAFVSGIGKFEQLGLLSAEVLRQQSDHLLHRAQRMARSTEAPKDGSAVASVTGLVLGMMRLDLVDAVPGWRACDALANRLPVPRQVQHSALLLEQGVRLYRHWRLQRGFDGDVHTHRDGLLSMLAQEVGRIPWTDLLPATQAVQLRRICLNLHVLANVLLRRKGRVQNRPLAERVQQVLREQAVPTLRQAVLQRQRPKAFDASNLELLLIQCYLPRSQWIAPPFEEWSDARCDALVWKVWGELAGAPRRMDGGSSLRIEVFEERAGTRKSVRVLDSSVYQTLFGSAFRAPALIELDSGTRPDNLNAYWGDAYGAGGRAQAEPLWRRNDLFRGGANQASENGSAHLWSVPVEAGRFFARHWLTSRESRCYAQRAFLPEEHRIESADKPRGRGSVPATPALKGEFAISAIPDSAPSAFVPKGDWGVLRPYDGCGFIHEDLARQLIGDEKYERLAARTRVRHLPAIGSVPAQALVHYSAKGEQLKAIVDEFHRGAQAAFTTPLSQQARIPSAGKLGHAARMGGPVNVNLTAVPASGRQALLADTPENRAMGVDGLLAGRAPFDNRGVLFLPRETIGYAEVLNHACALQVTATGYVHLKRDPGDSRMPLDGAPGPEVPESRFYKGLLVVLPKEAWPDSHPHTRIVVSAKDLKLCSGFDSLQSKLARQNPEQQEHVQLRGCLVVKQVLEHLVAIPPLPPSPSAALAEGDFPSMMRMGGDFDGDLVRVASAGAVPTLARRVAHQNREQTGSPKMPKTFHRDRFGDLDMQKLRELRGTLVQDASLVMERVLSLPAGKREVLVHELSGTHVLDEIFQLEDGRPGEWKALAGLGEHFDQLGAGKQARRLIRREMEVIVKSATDLEKTEIAYEVLRERTKQYKAALRDENARQKPWGKGTIARLGALEKERGARSHEQRHGDGPKPMDMLQDRQAVAQALGRSLDATAYFEGLPNAIVRANLSWFLERDPAPAVVSSVTGLQRRDTQAVPSLQTRNDALGPPTVPQEQEQEQEINAIAAIHSAGVLAWVNRQAQALAQAAGYPDQQGALLDAFEGMLKDQPGPGAWSDEESQDFRRRVLGERAPLGALATAIERRLLQALPDESLSVGIFDPATHAGSDGPASEEKAVPPLLKASDLMGAAAYMPAGFEYRQDDDLRGRANDDEDGTNMIDADFVYDDYQEPQDGNDGDKR